MIEWVERHSTTLFWALLIAGMAIPAIGNGVIRFLRRGGRKSPAADWLAAKLPLVMGAVHFAQDVIVNPRQFAKIEKRASELEDDPSPASAARMIVAVKEVELQKRVERSMKETLDAADAVKIPRT